MKNMKSRWRSLESIHNLWIESVDRSKKRQKDLTDIILKIVDNTHKGHNGNHKVYYKINDIYYVYSIEFNKFYGSHTFSSDLLKFDENTQIGRDQKLDFLLADEAIFKMGDDLFNITRGNSHLNYRVERELNKVLSRKLEIYFNQDIKKRPKDVFIVKIGNKKYYVSSPTNGNQYFGSYDFKLLHEVEENFIELS